MPTALPARPTRDAAYDDKFLVQDAGDVRRLLQGLADARSPLAEVDAEGAGSTILLALDPSTLYLEAPAGDDARRWLASPRLQLEGNLERVALRFRVGPLERATHAGRAVLAAPMPEHLLHLQRRRFVRHEPPTGSLVCRVPTAASGMVEATIRDIGGGGLAVLASDETIALALGDRLPGCVIELPGIGPVEVTLCVRHLIERPERGRDVHQAGCEFVDLPPATRDKLMRYLLQLDREPAATRG